MQSSVGPMCTTFWHYGIDKDTYTPTGTVIINNNAAYTSSRTVSLTLSSNDWGSGIYQMRFSEDAGVTWGPWLTYVTTQAFSLTPPNDGYKYVDVQFRDLKGYVSSSGSIWDGITLDTVAPTGTIVINSGAASTTSRTVTLTLTASDATSGVAKVRFSENMGSWTQWYNYAATFTCILNSTGDGSKSIDVQYQDNAGLTSTAWTIWDGITLDTVAPTGTIVINSGAASTTSRTVTLTLTASDATSGVAKVRFSENMGSWTQWYNYAATFTCILNSTGDGSKSIDVQYQDNAGLTSTAWTIWDGITLDTVAPTGTIVINSGAAYTTSRTVTLTLTASDATSGVAKVRF